MTTPAQWQRVALGDVCRLINGRAYKKNELLDKGKYLVLRVGNFFTNKTWYYSDLELDEDKYCDSGDLLYAWSASFGPRIWDGGKVIYHYHIWKTELAASCVHKRFMFHWFDWDKENIKSEQGVGTTMVHVTKGAMEERSLRLPPLNEQRRIADKIDVLQAKSRLAREALETVRPLLEKFRQSVLAAAFRGDLTAEWRKQHPDVEPAEKLLERIRAERRARWEEAELAKLRAKGIKPKNDKWKAKYVEPEPVDATGLPGLPEGWVWGNLNTISWNCGYGTSAKCDYEGSGNPVLRIPNVVGGGITLEDMKFSLNGLGLLHGDALRAGDFLIVRTNGSSDLIGRGAVVRAVPEDHFFASYLIRYRLLMSELLGEWVSAAWDSFAVRSKIKLLAASSAGQYNVSLSKLDQVLFPLPPADEIEVLNSMLRTAMGKISPIAKCLSGAESDLDRLDQSVLAKAFRGELVPQDPNDESASVLLKRIKDEREAAKGKKKTSRNKK